ncbi:MAG: class I SAM-dependent methyltransferase [Acidimicrobiia bacterium]|nr:class I SAM-dependent methyltransferase [Acidimicrobiia bacterium]
MSDELHRYVVDHGMPPDDLLQDLIAETREQFTDRAGMQIDAAQGSFLTLLARMVQPQFAVEVGTFTGYSSICIARGLPAGGRLVCCDISEEFTSVARHYWQRADLGDVIELRLGPALDTLAAMSGDPIIELAFIDADKTGYRGYYEAILGRMPSGGLIVVDNVLWSGRIIDEFDASEDTVALREFNDVLANDRRVDVSMLTVGDGLTLARKR